MGFWEHLARWCEPFDLDSHELVWGRSELLGLAPPTRISAGGSCRLLETVDSWWAVNLARPDDVAGVAAIVGATVADGDEWSALETWCATQTAARAAARAQLLGVPAAALGSVETSSIGPRSLDLPLEQLPTSVRAFRVVDLSSMWAGPLCARLLSRVGAEVTKVESPHRLDGARATPEFFESLHRDHRFVTIDFATPDGHRELLDLIGGAELVIDSSRARALRHAGIVAEDLVAEHGLTWVSITGYGRADDRVAFGDDAAVAGGLVSFDADGRPMFFGDAVADPLTGVVAAVMVLAQRSHGRAALIDVAMADVARSMWAAE